MMEFINAQLNESRVIFATASQQFAATLSGKLPCEHLYSPQVVAENKKEKKTQTNKQMF